MIKLIFKASLFVVILFFSLNHVDCQIYNGAVVNKDKQPIPYVNIIFTDTHNDLFGVTTNSSGKFEIAKSFLANADTIKFSSIGYQIKKIAKDDLSEKKENMICLAEKKYALNEIVVNDNKYKKRIITLGTQKNKSDAGEYYPLWSEVALYIPNNKKIDGYIKDVKIKLVNKTKSEVPIRLHIYGASKLGDGPQDELLPESVITRGSCSHGKWIVADIEKYRITFPPEGVFIGFEFIPPDGVNVTDTITECVRMTTDDDKPLRVQRGFVRGNDQCYTWERHFSTYKLKKRGIVYKGWKWYYTGEKDNHYQNVGLTNVIMCADVIFYK